MLSRWPARPSDALDSAGPDARPRPYASQDMDVRVRMVLLALAVVLAGVPGTPAAQGVVGGADASLAVPGGVQPRVGVDRQSEVERPGFGIRRAELQARVRLGQLGAEYDAELLTPSFQAIDLSAFAGLSDRVQVRGGRLAGAQPRALVPTSYTVIDAVDRAAIAERSALATIGPTHTAVALGPSPLAESDRTGLALSTALWHAPAASPGVERGASAGAGAGNERAAVPSPDGLAEQSHVTGSAHLYGGALPGSQPLHPKADPLSLRDDGVDAPDAGSAQVSVGVSGLVAARVFSYGEAFARAEWCWADAAGDPHGTDALSYGLSAARGGPYAASRLALAYTGRDVAGTPAPLPVFQGQLAF